MFEQPLRVCVCHKDYLISAAPKKEFSDLQALMTVRYVDSRGRRKKEPQRYHKPALSSYHLE